MKFEPYISKIKTPQKGFTLVEIMVAIALSLILIAGVFQIYISSKESFRVQNELARLQENQRIAVEILQNNIRQAGFKQYDDARIQNRITVTNGPNGANDAITVSFTSATDCLGTPTPASGIATNRFSILNGQLMCDGNGVDDEGNDALAAQPLVDGIGSMQILVGENTNFTNDTARVLTAERYVNVDALDTMINVVSVRIALLTMTQAPIKKQPTGQKFTVLDTTFDISNQPDRIKRQVVTTTIPLRNNS